MTPPAIPGTRIHVLSGKNRPVIINQSSLVHPPTRFVLAGLTAVVWAGWLSFWLPVAAFIGPDAGEGLSSLLGVLPKYSFYIGLMAAALLGWAGSNWFRFAQKERRTARPPVSTAALAGYFGVDPDELVRHRTGARIEISYDEQGRIVGIRSQTDEVDCDVKNVNN